MEKPEAVRNRRRSAQEKNKILSAYQQGTQTQKSFCRAHAISVPTLVSWLKRTQPLRPVRRSRRNLLEVPVFGRAGSEVVIELGAGLCVRTPAGVSVEWLRQLIGALRCGG